MIYKKEIKDEIRTKNNNIKIGLVLSTSIIPLCQTNAQEVQPSREQQEQKQQQ